MRGFGCALFYFQEEEKMKKVLAVILAAVMLLSFASCGGEAAGKVNLEELLVAEKWVNVFNRYEIVEFDTGNYGENAVGYYSSFEWKAIDNESVEGYSTYDGDRVFKYVLTEFEGVNALYNPARKEYYVQESVYDGIRENLVFPTYIAYGIVSMKDGNKDIITASELHCIEENYISYKEQYLDAKVTVVGEITKITSKTITIGEHSSFPNCWTIHDLNLNYDLSEFEIGDVVVATGIIEREFAAYVDVGENTTIKHYEG